MTFLLVDTKQGLKHQTSNKFLIFFWRIECDCGQFKQIENAFGLDRWRSDTCIEKIFMDEVVNVTYFKAR